jgi:nicotinate-nucleotide adenylyltransferase
VRIGVFGGSFDPVHHGHLLAASALAESLGLDEVRLVVAGRQPLKRDGHSAPPEDRAAMVELAVRGDPRLVAHRAEIAREGLSYTVDTLRGFRAEHGGVELVLLLGADAAHDLPRWHRAEEIAGLARVEVFSRAGEAGGHPVPRVDISSTDIRARVREGRSIRYWVPDAVAEYIASRRLYREDENGNG